MENIIPIMFVIFLDELLFLLSDCIVLTRILYKLINMLFQLKSKNVIVKLMMSYMK